MRNSMTEISKEMKIIVIINIIVGIIYGCLYFAVPDAISKYLDATYFDPHFMRLAGGTILVLTVSMILALIRGEWENVKPVLEVVMLWLIMTSIVIIIALVALPLSARQIPQFWFDAIICLILAGIDAFFCYREQK